MTGLVKNIMREKHFGFIRGENGTEYFFHEKENFDIWDKVKISDKVEFDPKESGRGPRAENVRVI